MNAHMLGNSKLVKISSWIYFIPLGLAAIILLAMVVAGANLFADPASSPAGNVYLLALLPILLFFAVATPIYFILLAAYASSKSVDTPHKAISIIIMIALAALWIWQVPVRLLS